MTCSACECLAARSFRQLELRARRVASEPDVTVYTCPICGGSDWLTTQAFIDVEPKRMTLYDRIHALAQGKFMTIGVLLAISLVSSSFCSQSLTFEERWEPVMKMDGGIIKGNKLKGQSRHQRVVVA